ncbi:MAG: hypothetical protein ABFS56_01925 [Pseudomonadota bacterium]
MASIKTTEPIQVQHQTFKVGGDFDKFYPVVFSDISHKLTRPEIIMEKLSIREASQTFGISRARLYQLLEKGIIAGHRSAKKGRGADSWIDGKSLYAHIKDDKHGRPKLMADGDYLPTRLAAKKTGYTTQYINQLIRQGSVAAKKNKQANLVYYPSLLKYMEK